MFSTFVNIFDTISLFAAELHEPKIGMQDNLAKMYFQDSKPFDFFFEIRNYFC